MFLLRGRSAAQAPAAQAAQAVEEMWLIKLLLAVFISGRFLTRHFLRLTCYEIGHNKPSVKTSWIERGV